MTPKLKWSKYIAPVTALVQTRSTAWLFNEFTVTPAAIRQGIGYAFPALVMAGAIFPPIGLICLAGMCAALSISPLNGRYWCAWLCPRGLFYEHWLSRVNPQKHVPPIVKTLAFRLFWLVVLMSALGVAVLRSQGDVLIIARSVMIMIIVTTAIGIGLGLQYYSRLWCMFCPIGTLSSWMGKGKNPVHIDDSKCNDCQLCAMSCPMAIQPQTFRSVGNIAHCDCLKCGKCVQVCPQQALELSSWTHVLARLTSRILPVSIDKDMRWHDNISKEH
jgi:ferredoxin-type protein NapH